MRRRRRLLIMLPVLVALLVAGCGGGGKSSAPPSKADYAKEVAAAGQTLKKTFAEISDQSGSGTTAAQIAQRLDQGATAFDDATKKFSAITPPPVAKADHQKIIAGLQQLAGVFRQGAAAARRDDPTALTKALQKLSTNVGVQQVAAAQADLKAKGIDISK